MKSEFPFLILIFLVAYVSSEQPFRRYEYKYSFKPPYVAQNDGSVPFWEYAGNTLASKDKVRITPSLKSQKGMIWGRNTVSFPWWEVEIHLRVSSRGRMGADGLAFWYTTERMIGGNVFGSKDNWNGLALIFDSYDNDGKGNNPYVSVVLNDGTKSYNHEKDGVGQILGGCLKDFRNKPHPVRARLTYHLSVLTLELHAGLTNSDQDYEICFRAESVTLPANGYFGLSAATGGMADDHDVLRVLTTSLSAGTAPAAAAHEAISDQERQKLKSEFDEYQRKTDQARDTYKREHPEEKEHAEESSDDLEFEQSQELRQIFDGQTHLFEAIKQLNSKMDEVVGRQERALSLISQVGQQQQQQLAGLQSPGGGSPQQQQQPLVQPHELAALARGQQEMLAGVRDLRTVLSQLQQQQQQLATAAAAGGGDGGAQHLNDVREMLQHVRRDVSITSQHLQQLAGAPHPASPAASCVSPLLLVGVFLAQLVGAAAFVVYRERRQSQAKKYY